MTVKLFVDLDGTLARFFEPENPVGRYAKEDDFFLKLNPYSELVEALVMISQESKADVLILSAVDQGIRESCIRQKEEWLRKVYADFGMAAPRALYPLTNTNKAEYVKTMIGGFSKDYWLLDDYTKNIREWVNEGGRAVKAINELNGSGQKWNGERVNILSSADSIYGELKRIMSI